MYCFLRRNKIRHFVAVKKKNLVILINATKIIPRTETPTWCGRRTRSYIISLIMKIMRFVLDLNIDLDKFILKCYSLHELHLEYIKKFAFKKQIQL